MERLEIGLDLDGIIADSAPVILEAITKKFRPGFSFKERGLGLDERVSDLEVDRDELLEYVAQLQVEEEYHKALKPIEGSLAGIKKLSQRFGVHILFNRPQTVNRQFDVRDLTYGWLCENGFRDYLTSLVLNPDHLDRSFKVREALARKIDVYVEDEPKEVERFANAGIKVVFFDPEVNHLLVDKNIKSVSYWRDIVEAVGELAAGV